MFGSDTNIFLFSTGETGCDAGPLQGYPSLGGVQGRTKPRSSCPGQVNIEVQCPSGQVKLASVDFFKSEFEKVNENDNFQSEANSISKLKTARLVTGNH